MKDECGVFGVFGHKDAARLSYFGLYALQHRGQESAGIVSLEKSSFYVVKEMGLVSEVFNPDNIHYLKGESAIGHVRYSTTGSSNINNIQPIYSKTSKGKLAIAHNGNITNALNIYKELKSEGALFQSTIDTEIILHMIARSKQADVKEAMMTVLRQIEGAFSLVILGEDCLIAARDPFGFRPLVMGKLGGATIFASETCALDLIGASYVREVEPGEMIYVDREQGAVSHRFVENIKPKRCVFEHVYFSRPDSTVFGENVHLSRKAFGAALAKEHPVEADMVMAIPDSGNSAALGYAEESGIPYEIGMTRNHYIGRTFIEPSQKMRDVSVKVKLNPISPILKDKRVVVVDDSLVRGTTSRQRVQAIRNAGAKEVHLRISSPPVLFPCHFGIDTPKRKKLIATQKTIKEIMDYVGADSLGYLSKQGMVSAFESIKPTEFCAACFDGKYPLKVKNKGKYTFEGRRIKLYAQKR